MTPARVAAALSLASAAALFPLSAPAAAQRAQPLRKTDLIRVLTGGALTRLEIADLVRRNCLSFTPTLRDRQDLVSLGADSGIMRSVDECAAAGVAGRTAAPTVRAATPAAARPQPRVAPSVPVRVPPRATPPVATRSPPTAPPAAVVAQPAPQGAAPAPSPVLGAGVPAPARTGFVSGLGQRGVVGQRAALPVELEVRDSTGAPLASVPVTLTVSNGRLLSVGAAAGGGGTNARTDSTGRVRVEVLLGERAGATVITAAIGKIVRQAVLYPAPGPAARLVATYKGASVDRQLVIDPDVAAVLHVSVQDAYGNVVMGRGVVAAVADGGVLKVTDITPDSLGALVRLKPGRAGGSSTGLVLQAGAVRLDLRVSVGARAR